VVLIGLAFFAGYLWNKNQTLEQAVKNGTNVAVNDPQQPAARPTELNIAKPTDKDHWRGNKDARFVFVEYSDLECPFCKKLHPDLAKIMEVYNGKLSQVFRHFPLSFHQNAQKEAEGSECMAELGGNDAFWKYQDDIFDRTTSNGTGFALDALGPLAAEIGVDQTAFQNCLDSGKYAQKVKDQENEGATAGVQATPTGVVYDLKTGKTHLIEGAVPYDQLKSEIDAFMKAQGA
jgi:protein-disulfide isomerase